MRVTACCGADYHQRKFMQKNGNRRPLSSEEFETLRGSEQRKLNYLWIPGVIFRWTCDSCGHDIKTDELRDGDAVRANDSNA